MIITILKERILKLIECNDISYLKQKESKENNHFTAKINSLINKMIMENCQSSQKKKNLILSRVNLKKKLLIAFLTNGF